MSASVKINHHSLLYASDSVTSRVNFFKAKQRNGTMNNRPISLLIEDYEDAKTAANDASQKLSSCFDDLMGHPDTDNLKATGANRIDERLTITTGESRHWDQEKLAAIKDRIDPKYWPFKTEYKEDAKKYAVVIEQFPELKLVFEEALTTKAKKAQIKIKPSTE